MAVTNSAREVTTLASMPRCAKYPRTAWALNSSQAGLGARLSSAEGLQLSSISRRGKLPARACTLTGAAAAGAALTVKVSLASTVPTGEPLAAVGARGHPGPARGAAGCRGGRPGDCVAAADRAVRRPALVAGQAGMGAKVVLHRPLGD